MKLHGAIVLGSLTSLALFSAHWVYRNGEQRRMYEQAVELVMHENVDIDVKGVEGVITISSANGLRRQYSWGNCSLSTTLIPRPARWYGLLGAYDPAPSLFPYFGRCNGISRPVVDEGQLYFDDPQLATEYLRWKATVYDTAWSEDGLVVSWRFFPSSYQLSAGVVLLCLNGEPFQPFTPSKLGTPVVRENEDGLGLRACNKATQQDVATTRDQLEPLLGR